MNWQFELAVVTGASRGIGKALAQGLADRGAAVAVCARDAIAIERFASDLRAGGGKAFGAPCDVRDEAEVAAFAARVQREMGSPTIVVNNAGIARFAPVTELSVEQWDEVLATNLRGMFLVTRAFLPAMLAHGHGAIVNVASLAGRNGFASGAAYCASKHGVLGFSKSLMMEVRKRDIRVIAVCPGSVSTAFFDGHTPFQPDREKILRAEDVATVVLETLALDERATVSELDIRPTNP
ncbi:MAG TPA: SDR family NAD(P)-dependent oxidoreductase [Gemmatimonadales bacterium]|nr:SDR family NAD(P)-dependent oxidoreductase [Gemmatimonadales bacterium]